ncbi:MAG: immunoglobulin-like domain-containing protein, partial [bacterium]
NTGASNAGIVYLFSSNAPPVADAGDDQTVECASPAGTQVTLDGSGSSDPNNDLLTYTWRENGNIIAGPTTEPTAPATLSHGSHTIELTVDDGKGGTDTDEVIVNVVDTTPPVITLNGANPMTVECLATYVEPNATVNDACDPAAVPDISGSVDTNVPGSYAVTYTATDASGNSASIMRTVIVECSLPHPFVLLAQTKVLVDHQLVSAGDIHSNDKIEFRDGNPSIHTGNLTAVGDITIKKNNNIDGNVTAGKNLTLDGSSTITGTATSNATVAPYPLPTFSFTDGAANVTVPASGSLSLAPGSYHDVKVGDGGSLSLSHDGSSGEYFFHKLELGKSAILSMDVSPGPVAINLVQKFHFAEDMKVVIAPAVEVSPRLATINIMGADNLHIHESSNVFGNINAPNASVILYDSVFFKGAIAAKGIEVRRNVTCLHHSSSGSTPLAKISTANVGGKEESNESECLAATEVIEYDLEQNYPNPFRSEGTSGVAGNPETEIRFALPEASHVVVKIFNLLGEEIRTLADGDFAAGKQAVRWNARNDRGEKVPSGMYFYRLVTPKFSETKKLILAK